jgi:hypothetical protein
VTSCLTHAVEMGMTGEPGRQAGRQSPAGRGGNCATWHLGVPAWGCYQLLYVADFDSIYADGTNVDGPVAWL